MPLRVVFDTNAFSGGSFAALKGSRLVTLCQRDEVVPIYGHVFIEETLRSYGNSNKREALVTEWLPFITATARYICNDFNTIWHEELVQGRGRRARIFMP